VARGNRPPATVGAVGRLMLTQSNPAQLRLTRADLRGLSAQAGTRGEGVQSSPPAALSSHQFSPPIHARFLSLSSSAVSGIIQRNIP
jgi:hypothetical protein